jgi:predicted transcriptional regulator
MQTTLTLDDELAEELEEVAHRAGKPFTDVVNETLRKGLHPAGGALSPKPYRLETVALGVRDIDKARHIADALEDEEILRKLKMGK